ncbi:hypothetical protein L2D08_06935 [Domibacillus sp. PGB-M46]|uniref:hypothetical protein n=1 Tax=Domibacillus sp. PGB-M46 TaxID=2910255 RepID=UPI001F58B62A|nr:hypothetical protein [Domibacillus sp. PGB-M46]MCI2254096.1 hypothetical protein [Domibacillus sp. PGB-M46]
MTKVKVKKPLYKKWWVWVLAIFFIGAVANSGETETETAEPFVDEAKESREKLEQLREVDAVIEDGEELVGTDVNEDGQVGDGEATEEVSAEEPVAEPAEVTAPAFENPATKINKDEFMANVKKQAETDFPDDYMTQDFVVEEQDSAYEAMVAIVPTSDAEVRIIENAIADFPNDMMTAKFVYDEQMKAMNN